TLADVAASSDLTGHASFGGDWELERSAGSIEATVAISAEVQQTYKATLVAPVVTVDPLNTSDTTPQLTGTVDNPASPIVVTVDGNDYIATNNGDGTWILPNDTISTLTDGTYDVGVTAYEFGTIETVSDDFNPNGYSGNDGTQNWSGNWVEFDPAGGNFTVLSNRVRVDTNDGPNGYLYREADLTGATTATLSLDVSNPDIDGNDRVRLEVSGNGGGSWTTLKTYDNSNKGSYTDNFDISSYTAADTQIRLYIATDDAGDYIFFDNIQIEYDSFGGDVGTDATTNELVIDTNQPPVIGGTDTGSVTEDVGVVGGDISDSGTLTIADPDAGESSFQAATINGTYGDLTIDAAGNWSYSAVNSQAAIQTLDVGETLIDTLTVTSFDGTTHDVTITINGAEDAAVIGGTATGTVAEDGSLVASNTMTITDVDTSDNPINFNNVVPTLGDNGYGNFEITGNTWTFTLNNAHASVQALDVGESLNDTFTFTASDGSTQVVTITINGAEDAAVIGGTAAGTVAEDGSLIASNTLTITDVDTSDNPISFNNLIPTLGNNGYGNFEITGNTWTYTLNNAHAAVQALNTGDSLTDTFTFTANDGSTQVVTITINGANETGPAVIGGTDTGSVTEDVGVVANFISTSGSLTITDPDAGESSFQAGTVNGTYGDLTIDASGNWSYSADNTQAAIQSLDVGETLVDTLTVTSFDGTTHDVTITINGTEDAPVIGGTSIGTVAEDGSLIASNTLTVTDVDTNDNPISFNNVIPTIGDNGYGNFEITANTWIFTLNNAHAAVQALDVGENLNDTFTFTASDGSTQVVTITINGAEDAAVIGGTSVGAVAEDGTLTASDTLTITDVDTSDNPISFNDVAATLGDNGYGNFEITGNTWTFTLNNAHASVQALDVGQTLNDTFTFTASDGSTQVVTITINGAEDAAVIGGTSVGAVTEDGSLTASNTLTITDVDTSDNPISFNNVLPTLGDFGYGNFEITGNSWTYTLNNAHASVQGLDVGETINDTYTYTATDGSTQVVTVTITGTEDAPTVDNAIGNQVAIENAAFSFTVAANAFSDPDTSDTLTYTATLADNSALPVWLTFNPVTLNFSGTPASTNLGSIDVKVSADDGTSTITDTFQLAVNPVVPPVGVNPVSIPTPSEEPAAENNTPVQIIASIAEEGGNEEALPPGIIVTPGIVAEEPVVNLEQQIESLLGQTGSEEDAQVYHSDVSQPAIKSGKFNNIPINHQQALQDQLSNQAKLGSLFDADNNLVGEHERKLWKHMDAMNRQMSDDASRDEAQVAEAQVVMGSTVSLTAGFVGWALRGGSLLASMMSSVSVLGSFDPVPILKKSQNREDVTADDPDEDSTDDTNQEPEEKVEKIFSGDKTS
ncbi:MAG: hypothetical protein DRI30_01525, partial [Chloroflexi bacterium]